MMSGTCTLPIQSITGRHSAKTPSEKIFITTRHQGGAEQKTKHQDWYAGTLGLYKSTFEQDPPIDIWPAPAASGYQLPVPSVSRWLFFERGGLWRFLFLTFPVLALYHFEQPNPFSLSGPHFLFFYFSLAAATVAITTFGLNTRRKSLNATLTPLLPIAWKYQPAFLYESAPRLKGLLRTLEEEGTLIPGASSSADLDVFLINPQPLNGSEHPLAPFVRQHRYPTISRDVLIGYAADIHDHVKLQFSLLQKAFDNPLNNSTLPALTIAVGIIRCCQGLINEKPITYLVLMLVLFTFLCYVLFSANRFHYVCSTLAASTSKSKQSETGYGIYNGLLALGVTSGRTFWTYWQSQSSNSGNSCSGGSSCGGSSCGGGGCGGCGGD